MSKFFNCLVSEELINDWAYTLDCLFDNLKFSKIRNWNGGYTSHTQKILSHLNFAQRKKKELCMETTKV